MPSNVTAAVVQAGAIPFDTPACVDKAATLIAAAADKDARLIVFPEAFIGGYPKGLSFGAVVGARDAAGRDEFRRYLDGAIAVPGPETERLGEAAAAHGAYVVIGVIERELGTLLLHGALLRTRRASAREAPEAHADGHGAAHLGVRRRLDAHRCATARTAVSAP